MSFNPASSIILPAKTTFRGVEHHAKGDITVMPLQSSAKVRLQTGGTISYIERLGYKVTIPIIAPFADLLPLYQYLQDLPYGKAIAPHIFLVETVNAGSETLTITGHPFASGDSVHVQWDESPPTCSPVLSKTTEYFARADSADTISLYDTSGHAIAGGATGRVAITAADGLGNLYIAHAFPLLVHSSSGVLDTFLNAAPMELPSLVLAGGKLLWDGNLSFECYPGLGKDPTDGQAAFFTRTSSAYTGPAWDDGDNLAAQDVEIAWGATPPWDSFRCEEGLKVNFGFTFDALHDGKWPGSTSHMNAAVITAEGIPWGITSTEFHALFNTNLGDQMNGEDLVITASGIAITLTNAVVDDSAELRHGPASRLVGPVKWTAHGTSAQTTPPFEISAGA